MQEFINNSTLTRLFANIFLFVLVIGCAVVACIEILRGVALNPFIIAILSAAMGSSIKLLGVSAGVTFAERQEK